ncbi:hypothetical protein PG997_001513 [Apiospora hydei]|uniref:Uncharacterized protein n=1 Tax=Apiospora hydei TaxID=1337664 RepID=A0ABR1XE71_9PEZI
MSGFYSYTRQGQPRASPQRQSYIMDEEEDEEDYTPYAVDHSRAAYSAPFQQSNDLLRRRASQMSPANQLYSDGTSYEDQTLYEDQASYEDITDMEDFADMDYLAPTPTNERHYSTSFISPKSVRFSEGADSSSSNNIINNTSPIPAASIESDSTKYRHRRINGTNTTITTINSTAPEALRIFYQAASIVKKTFNWAMSAWNALCAEMGPLFQPMVTFLAFMALLLFLLAEDKSDPYGPIIWAFGVAFKNLGRQFIKGQRLGALRRDVAFNITEYFAGDGSADLGDERVPWRLYEQVLRDADGMETWFDEARAVDDVVSALWAGLPPLSGVVVAQNDNSSGNNNSNSTGSRVVYQPQPMTVTVTFSRAEPESTRPWEKKEDNPWKKMDAAADGKEAQDENTKAVMRRLRMRSAIDMRSTLRKRAEAYFENFLAGRVIIIGRVLDDARRFGELVETHVVVHPNTDDNDDEKPAEQVSNKISAKFHADVAAKFGLESTSASKMLFWKKDKFAEVEVTNRTNYMLSYMGLHLMSRLVASHTALYASARLEPAGLPADLRGQASSTFFAPAQPDTLTALADLRRAEQAERAFLGDLIAQSAYGATLATPRRLPRDWTDEPATRALEKLIERMGGLERRLQSVSRRFAFLAERMAAQVANETGGGVCAGAVDGGGSSGMPVPVSEMDRPFLTYGVLRWGEAAEELLGGWGRGMVGVEEARKGAEESGRELERKRREGVEGMEGMEGKGRKVRRWRMGNCEGASCWGDIVESRQPAIGEKKKEKKEKATKGWFWSKKSEGEEREEEGAEEVEGEEAVQSEQQKPLSGSSDEGKFEKGADDDTPEKRATREKLCCGYSMHNEWADMLMYGDQQFTYQDLYSGQPEEVLS